MPELPDVELRRRYVTATCLHQAIDAVEVDAPRMLRGLSASALRAALEGTSFAGTARHGKYLFVLLDSGTWLLLHFGMTGELVYHRKPRGSPRNTRLSIHFARGGALRGVWQRRLGRIGLVDDPGAFVKREELGPDALDHGLTPAAFSRRFRDRRGGVKSTLMDQSFLAGIGNIYSDEILFQARLHPGLPCRDLDDRQLAALHRSLRHVLRLAIERHVDPARLPRSWLLPKRRKGAKCPRCGTPLQRMSFSGRTAWLCPSCQPRGARA